MNSHEIIEHSTPAELAHAVASQVGETLASAISQTGYALAFVPGGSTPKAIFPLIAHTELDWSKVTLVPGDERVAPGDSGHNNFAMLRQAFSESGANLLPLTDEGDDCENAAAEADAQLHALRWPPDLVWLGLGTDGHFASIFPGKAGEYALTCESARAVCVQPDPLPPEAPFPRVTLTLPAILSANAILIAASGEAKKAILEAAFAGEADHLPISTLLREAHQAIDIHWSPE